MIGMYCTANHAYNETLCQDCQWLSDYADQRLSKCQFGKQKPVCKDCKVHCYSPERREQMRIVMRWAGPRMMFKKPIYAIVHIIDNHNSKVKAAGSIKKQCKSL